MAQLVPPQRHGTQGRSGDAFSREKFLYEASALFGFRESPVGNVGLRGFPKITTNPNKRKWTYDVETQFQIVVKTLAGEYKSIWVQDIELVSYLKGKIHITTGIPAMEQSLIYVGKLLEGGNRLKDYSIKRNSSIVLNLRLKGGATGVSNSARSK